MHIFKQLSFDGIDVLVLDLILIKWKHYLLNKKIINLL